MCGMRDGTHGALCPMIVPVHSHELPELHALEDSPSSIVTEQADHEDIQMARETEYFNWDDEEAV